MRTIELQDFVDLIRVVYHDTAGEFFGHTSYWDWAKPFVDESVGAVEHALEVIRTRHERPPLEDLPMVILQTVQSNGEHNQPEPIASEPAHYGRERRYKCLTCLDSGMVKCWHTSTMDSVYKQDDVIHWYTCGVACTCNAGDIYAVNRNGKERPRFNRDDWIPVAEGKDALYEWAAKFIPRHKKEGAF